MAVISDAGKPDLGKLQDEMDNHFTLHEQKIKLQDTFLGANVYRIGKEPVHSKLPDIIFLKSYSSGKGGLSKHCEILKYRFMADYKIECRELLPSQRVNDSIVLMEHHPGIVKFDTFMDDVKELVDTNNSVFIELHSLLKCPKESLSYLEKNTTLLYRSNENAREDGAKDYKLFPVIAYSNINVHKPKNAKTCLGTFGFPFKHKGLDEIINFSIREDIPLEAYLSVNNETNDNLLVTQKEITRLKSRQDGNVKIFTEYMEDEALAERLSQCTHIIFANKGGFDASGTMQFAKRVQRPIVCIDSLQSRMAQTYRVKIFSSRSLALKRETLLLVKRILSYRKFRGGYLNLGRILSDFFGSISGILFSKKLTKDKLLEFNHPTREEDGMEYLISYISNLEQFAYKISE